MSSPTPYLVLMLWRVSLLKTLAWRQYDHKYQKHKRSPVVVEASRTLLRPRSS